MKKTKEVFYGVLLALMFLYLPVFGKDSSMPDSYPGMPQMKATETYTATGKEDWSQTTGFGADSTMIGMMNEMMVGGSGMENMKMNMNLSDTSKQENGSTKKDDDSNMEGMDMSGGSDMKNMNMGKNKKESSSTATLVSIQAALKEGAPKVGTETLILTLSDPVTGKPLEKLNVACKVFMTIMDMGTAKPKVDELGKGRYQVKVKFVMAGPWRVELNIAMPDQKQIVKDLDFNARMPE